jgi:hypothetical protein
MNGFTINRRIRHWNSRRIVNRAQLRLISLESRIAPATYTVTNNSNSGAGSLRQAVINANGSGGADTINFLVIPSPITLTTGEIAINEALTIKGPGADSLTVSGNNLSRIFNTTGAPAGAAISINGLTLTGGNEPAAGANGGFCRVMKM